MEAVVRKDARVQHRSAPGGNERRLVIQHPRRRFLSLAAGAAALPAFSHVANAQAYPTRPITMVVPFPPGGATDVIARNVAGRMRAALGQPVIIETGAAGMMPSRYMLMMASCLGSAVPPIKIP